jgi:hypothetical protein
VAISVRVVAIIVRIVGMSIGFAICDPIIISLPSILPHIHQFSNLLFMLFQLVPLLQLETVIDFELPVDLLYLFFIKVNF